MRRRLQPQGIEYPEIRPHDGRNVRASSRIVGHPNRLRIRTNRLKSSRSRRVCTRGSALPANSQLGLSRSGLELHPLMARWFSGSPQLRPGICASDIGFWFFGLPMLWVPPPLSSQLENAKAANRTPSEAMVDFRMVFIDLVSVLLISTEWWDDAAHAWQAMIAA